MTDVMWRVQQHAGAMPHTVWTGFCGFGRQRSEERDFMLQDHESDLVTG